MKLVLFLVLIVLFIFSINLFWPSGKNDINHQNNFPEEISENVGISEQNQANHNDDLRSEMMVSEYKILEKERRLLKNRLARLKHHMWGLKFEKQQAKEMNEILIGAHQYIKNPPMLGAFSDITTIKDETIKIKFANKSLDRVADLIQKQKETKK